MNLKILKKNDKNFEENEKSIVTVILLVGFVKYITTYSNDLIGCERDENNLHGLDVEDS